jgi:hypothetical protein
MVLHSPPRHVSSSDQQLEAPWCASHDRLAMPLFSPRLCCSCPCSLLYPPTIHILDTAQARTRPLDCDLVHSVLRPYFVCADTLAPIARALVPLRKPSVGSSQLNEYQNPLPSLIRDDHHLFPYACVELEIAPDQRFISASRPPRVVVHMFPAIFDMSQHVDWFQ